MNSSPTDWIKNNSPIGIFGGGVSGVAISRLIKRLGGESIIYDERSEDPERAVFTHEQAAKHSLIVNSPGFPPSHQWFLTAKEAGCMVLGEIEFASKSWEGQIYLVTGTNGKSTITQLLTEVLLNLGIDARAYGNIGIPFSEHYKYGGGSDSVAVIEVSSFQAWNFDSLRADGIIWSNFAEDHLDWHGSMPAYFDAKWNALCQVNDGPIVMGSGVLEHAKAFEKEMPMVAGLVKEHLYDAKGNPNLSAVNRLNVQYVKSFIEQLGFDETKVDEVVSKFPFLPHRLEFVGSYAGVRFWNDSKATNFHAVEAALDSFYEPVIWIGGGLEKGATLDEFVARIAPSIKVAVVFGEVSEKLNSQLTEEGVVTYLVDDLDQAMQVLKIESHPGSNVVLSPGFASFDQFKGYADRGHQFVESVHKHFAFHTQHNPTHINYQHTKS